MSFPYKRVLLVGATSGIGLAMAEKLITSGIKVIAVGRRQSKLDSFVQKHGSEKASAIPYDIGCDPPTLRRFIDTVTATYPDLDCVFLNAGIQRNHDFSKPETVKIEDFHEEMRLNFGSFVDITHGFLPFFLAKEKTPTSFVYTGSNLALIPSPAVPGYSASKAALSSFILGLRDTLAHAATANQVKIIELSPPPVQTELHDETMGENTGRGFGMPLDAFTEAAYEGLASGSDQVVVGSVGPREGFMEIVDKRRSLFEWLAGEVRSRG